MVQMHSNLEVTQCMYTKSTYYNNIAEQKCHCLNKYDYKIADAYNGTIDLY